MTSRFCRCYQVRPRSSSGDGGDDLEVGIVGLALGQRLERRPQELHAAVAERQVEGCNKKKEDSLILSCSNSKKRHIGYGYKVVYFVIISSHYYICLMIQAISSIVCHSYRYILK